jgi:hypothetical protein
MHTKREPSSTQYTEESKLLDKAIEWLEPQRRDGIVVIKIRDKYAKGYSDLFINARGRFVVAELKDNKGTATPHQEDFIDMMNKAGGVGGVCRSVKDIADLINAALYCICTEEHNPTVLYCPRCGKETKWLKP